LGNLLIRGIHYGWYCLVLGLVIGVYFLLMVNQLREQF